MATQSTLDHATETTIISALVFYGLRCVNGEPCVDALRALDLHKAADVLAAELVARRRAA